METLPIYPLIDNLFQHELRKPEGVLVSDNSGYFLNDIKLFQKSCVIYRDGSKMAIHFTFCDYGVKRIYRIGFSLIVETKHHKYSFQETYLAINYYYGNSYNQFDIRLVDLQLIPFEKVYIQIKWVSYTDGSKRNIEKPFVPISKSDLDYILKIDNITTRTLTKKEQSQAWKNHDELVHEFSELEQLIENAQNNQHSLIINRTKGNNNSTILVPINCYFDKGFYSAIYYAQYYPVVAKRLSGGKSAIQYIIAVDKSDIEVLMYLYYCTIVQREYYRYFTEEQLALKHYLQTAHPIMRIEEKISDIEEKYPYEKIVQDADILQYAKQKVASYYKHLNTVREQVYNRLVRAQKTHGRWKNEYKLFFLIKTMFPDAIFQYSAEWLGHQTLDIFIPCAKCAIEYQGLQHYQAVEYFGGDSHFIETQELDQQKRKKCQENGVTLLEWPYTIRINVDSIYLFLVGKVPSEFLSTEYMEQQLSILDINNLHELLINISTITDSSPNSKVEKKERIHTHVIRKYSIDGKFLQEFPSVKEAAQQSDLSIGGISKVIYGERKTAGGYQWRRCPVESSKDNISSI